MNDLAPFTLTYVVYERGDILGKFLAVVTLSPIFIMVMYATLIVFRRDLQTIFVALGQIIGVLLTIIIKKNISQERPKSRFLITYAV